MRGEDSLLSSISIAEREEGPGGISIVIRCEEKLSDHNMTQRRWEKRSDRPPTVGYSPIPVVASEKRMALDAGSSA
jgi:hypothetical protein